jgi:hypothetical protein
MLAMTDAQKETFRTELAAKKLAMPDHAAMKDHMASAHTEMLTRLRSFASDTFDAATFVAPPAGMPANGHAGHMEHMANVAAVLVPILDSAQREKLAAHLEQGPGAHGDCAAKGG